MGATRHRWGRIRGNLLPRHNLPALFAAGIVGLKLRTMAGFGVPWFFLHLLPTNSFIPRLDVANDRQLCLATWRSSSHSAWKSPGRARPDSASGE